MSILIAFAIIGCIALYITHRLHQPKPPSDIHAALIVQTERELIEAQVNREDFTFKVIKLQERLKRLKSESALDTMDVDAEANVVHFINANRS